MISQVSKVDWYKCSNCNWEFEEADVVKRPFRDILCEKCYRNRDVTVSPEQTIIDEDDFYDFDF